jgi:type I restriction enzyme S subunit
MYEHLRNIAIGSSTIPLLNKTEFEKIEILHPAVETLDLFEARMSTLTNKIKLNKQQIHLLFDLKTLLLQRITDA